jgi:glycosidase
MKRFFSLSIFIFLAFTQIKAQTDFRKETIYFLLTTRFFDGDSANNAPNEWCSYIPGVNNPNITDPKDVTWRGDFKGLIQKLDYIKGMGFTAIWITPIVQNRGPLDYHGYHAWDFTKVDPRLESPGATFQDLVNAIHAKGMKIVLDIVTNHSGRFGIKNVAELKYNTDTTKPWGKNLAGGTLKDNPNWEFDGLTKNPDDDKRWSRANLAKMPAPYNQNLAAWNWPCTEAFVNTSNPTYFHQSGNGFAQGWDDTTNLYQRALADDCPDLNTESQALQDYMFNAYKTYLDMGVDAFRWDTWKHMNKQSIIALYDRFKAYKPNLFVFGEVAQKRFELHPVQEINPHWYTWRGGVGTSAGLDVGVLDFYGEATFHNIFEDGGAFSGVTDAARYDNLYSDPTKLVTWLDNHDFGPHNDWNRRYGGSIENLAACMNFMFTWRGIPSVYYGTESQFKKGAYTDLHDASGIQKSLNVTGRAYFGEEFATAQNTTLYAHIKKLNDMRKAIPALQNGNYNFAGNYPGNGIGFTRSTTGSFVCVGLAKDGAANFNFTGLTNGVYRDAVTGREVNVTNGTLQFNVPSLSAAVYVLNGPGMIGEGGTGYFAPCVTGCAPLPKVAISPVGDNYTNPVTVNINATNGTGAKTIYYTTNGQNPTTASTVYTGSFNVSTATTVKAIAVDANGKVSDLEAQVYTFVLPKPKVSFNPPAGNYYNPLNLVINATNGKAPYRIYFTTNGSTPNTNGTGASTLYTGPIAFNTAWTFKAIVIDSNNQVSDVVTASYTFNIPSPIVTASPASSNIPSGVVNVSLTASSPRMPVTIYYTTDGTNPTISSTVYSTLLNLTGGTPKKLKYFGVDSEGRIGSIDSSIYTFNPIPDITVYFKKPSSWATPVKIHYWNALPTGNLTATNWPGVNATRVCPTSDWWKFTFNNVTSLNVIFNDGTGKQTIDLNNVNTTSYFDFNTKLTSTPDVEAPIGRLVATPITGTAPLTVNFNASISSGCTALGYFWEYGNGNNQQTGLNATASQVYANAGTYNMYVVVQDQNNKRDTVRQTITVTSPTSGQTIHLKPATTWTNTPRMYFWNTTPVAVTTGWPGVTMVAEGNGWFKYTIPGVNCSNIVFNNNSSPQTADLQKCGEAWYDGTIPAWVNDPLPLKFIAFSVISTKEKYAQISFTTANEINVSHFSIQYSTDGKDFETVEKISAKNGSYNEYDFVYKIPTHYSLLNTIYYRIEAIDKNGAKAYSKTKKITLNNLKLKLLSVYPNPTKEGKLNIDFGEEIKAKTNYVITTIEGRVVQQGVIVNQQETINIKSLSKGMYIIKFDSKQKQFVVL